MKKLLSFLGAIGLVATSSATVVSCGNDSDKFTTYELGEVAITATDAKAAPSDILAAVQTSTEANKDYAADFAKVMEEFKDADLSKMKSTMSLETIGEINDKTDLTTPIEIAKVTWEKISMDIDADGKNDFNAELKFTLKDSSTPATKTDLGTAVATKELGELADATPATIVAAINDKNASLNLTEADVDVTVKQDNTGATIAAKADSANFTGTVDVTFTVKTA